MKPILFNTAMVRALLDGRKTETRRVVKPQPPKELQYPYGFINGSSDKNEVGKYCWTAGEICDGRVHTVRPPYRTGDILYVRETWREHSTPGFGYIYKVDYMGQITETALHWHPSIHMPREAARIFLRVTDVRVERLQDITEGGAKAEGAKEKRDFIRIWNNTIPDKDNQQLVWSANPLVWVIEFERTAKPNEK